MTLVVCAAQLNLIVGDLPGNAHKIITAARAAYQDGVRLVLTPELSICGYAAEDLFLRAAFIAACTAAVQTVADALADLADLSVVVGSPVCGDDSIRLSLTYPPHSSTPVASGILNAAYVLQAGRVVAVYAKRELPNYQVFDERRYFVPGRAVCVFEAGPPSVEGRRVKVGLLICEDAWFETPALEAKAVGAELLVVINASPFHAGKGLLREQMMQKRVQSCKLPLVYAHLVGGQDELVFEGRSFAMNADGTLAGRAPGFVEHPFRVQCHRTDGAIRLTASTALLPTPEADLWSALVLGVRDYVDKNGFAGVLLGLSGGIDSALVLAIAVDALGADRVRAVMMPSPYTADISWIDASDMARRLGVRYDELSIAPMMATFSAALADEFKGRASDTTEENVQARIRATLLMALSNKLGHLVLTTGNKSEMAVGYCTLYGDMAGGFAVIKDLTKTTVFKLAHWRNAHDPNRTGASPIPQRIITRPPSAELRSDQKDEDSLPPYDILDAIVERYVENNESTAQIMAAGLDAGAVLQVTQLIKANEYKRRQAPIGVRVTPRSFGKDWRYPITNWFGT